MDNAGHKRAEEIFQQAADLPEEERPSFIDQVCRGNAELRKEVESLLACLRNDRIESLIEVDRVDENDLQLPHNRQIGPYKIVQLIGEGGFGSVFEAEQERPIKRKVALKVIKLGMDTKKVIARFEAERQALALMDHPSIAKVLDAGATDTGRPYFVMERVDGIPITEFCDRHNLSIKQRLELFIRVCQAVQHAHQKGIIHRDIKPSNVLVAFKDGAPMPKVIDFGIAKATNRRLNEETFFTDYQYFMGTPEYMSPEQVGTGGSDIDTRTDVYSMGVLLYVILTSKTPFDWKTLGRAAFIEVQRIIQEEDPPTPSVCASKLGPDLDLVARTRRLAPHNFNKSMRGDLDWIVMKALEKDRGRRYETATDFAEDIQRHLNHEPVQAGPPGALYIFSKFIRRHRIGMLAAAGTAAALIVGLALAAMGWFEAEAARKSAEISAKTARLETAKAVAINDFLHDMLAYANPDIAMGRDLTVRKVLTEATIKIDKGAFKDQPEVEAALRMTLANTYESLGLLNEAEKQARKAEETCIQFYGKKAPETRAARKRVGVMLRKQARHDKAEAILQPIYEMELATLGKEHPTTLRTMEELGIILYSLSKHKQAETLLRENLALRRQVSGEEHLETVYAQFHLGTGLWHFKKSKEALFHLEQSLADFRALLGEKHPDTLNNMNNLGLVLSALGENSKSEEVFRQAIKIQRVVFGENHPDTHRSINNLINLLDKQGKYAESRQVTQEKVVAIRLAAEDPNVDASHLNTFAWFLLTVDESDLQDPEGAMILAKQANALSFGQNADILDTLALAMSRTGELGGALDIQRKAVVRSSQTGSVNPPGLELTLLTYLAEKHGFDPPTQAEQAFVAKKLVKTQSNPFYTGAVLAQLALIYSGRGHHQAGMVLAEECLSLRKMFLPEGHWLFADCWTVLGVIHADQKQIAKGTACAGEAVKIIEALPLEETVGQKKAIQDLINLFEALEKPQEAAAWLKRLKNL